MALTTTGSSGGLQTTTQTPQASAQPSSMSSQQDSAVQPGTANNLLTNSGGGGLPLQNSQLSTISLAGLPATTKAVSASTAKPAHHQVNPVLIGFPVLLLLAAVIIFLLTNRYAKITTEYS